MKLMIKQKLTLAVGLMLAAGTTMAGQQNDNQVGWYVGGLLGQAKTDVSQGDINGFLAASGLTVTNLSIDQKDTASAVFGGYQFNRYFAVEAGYLDLGERNVALAGQTADPDAFFDNVEHIYPQSGEGFSLSLVGSYPLSHKLKLSGKLGYFDWEGDYTLTNTGTRVGGDKISGSDFLYGAEFNYGLSEQIQLFASYQRIKLNRDTNQVWGLGLRYYFND